MQRVRFLVDFQGVLTAERFFAAGAEAEFDDEIAQQLIADGRAVLAGDEEPAAAATGKRKR